MTQTQACCGHTASVTGPLQVLGPFTHPLDELLHKGQGRSKLSSSLQMTREPTPQEGTQQVWLRPTEGPRMPTAAGTAVGLLASSWVGQLQGRGR